MSTKITFLRHGETDANRASIFLGSTDVPLNENGLSQAREAARRLRNEKYDLFLYGGRLRVRQTAEIVLAALKQKPVKVRESDDIYEIDFGAFEGRPYREIEKEYPEEWERYMENWGDFTFPGGGNTAEYFAHCARFANGLKKNYPRKSILVVGHKGFILCCAAALHNETSDKTFARQIHNGQTLVWEE